MSRPMQGISKIPRSARLPDLDERLYPLRMFTVIIVSIFIAEIVAMAVVYFMPSLPYQITTLIDAGIMVILIFPILYLFSLKPLLQHIVKLQEAERALHQKEELQQRFFNSIDVMIAYMDRDFNFIKVNDAYAGSAEGRTPEYFPGRNHFAMYPHAENQVIFQKVVDTGEPYIAFERPFEYPDQPERGVTYWDWSLQPVKGLEGDVEGLVLSLMDVTERKRAEQKVELERSRLRSILDAMPDGVYIVNQQFDIEYFNPVIERNFGPVNGQKCYAYFHDRDEVCDWCKNPEILKGRSVHWELSYPKVGKIFEVFDTPLTNSDGQVSKLKLMHDITDRKQSEIVLEKRNLELQALSASDRRQRQAAETLRLAAQTLSRSLDLDIVLQTLLKYLRELTQADTASAIFPEGETQLGVRAVEGYEKWTDPNVILSTKVDSATNPLFQKLISTRRTLLIPDTAVEPDWAADPGTLPIHSCLYVPITIEDKLVGFIGLGKAEAGYFLEEHVQWAEVLVGQAAVAIQNAWLF
ncbi:MAG TPA: GAF domain-containing protein, partial [Anaerolineales bacterium]